jgi:hypothetical protein
MALSIPTRQRGARYRFRTRFLFFAGSFCFPISTVQERLRLPQRNRPRVGANCDDRKAPRARQKTRRLMLQSPDVRGAALDLIRCFKAHRQSPRPRYLRKHTRRQGPFLRRHYPASMVLRPCPTPAMAAALRDVEAATLTTNGSPPINRTTFLTSRAHYPGGSNGCVCRLLPRSCSLPPMADGSASALVLSRPAQASLTLRPVRSLSRARATFVTRLQPVRVPVQAARQLPAQSTTLWADSSSTGDSPFGAHGQERPSLQRNN